MDSETLSVRNQGAGCALAWVTISRDSESDYPFYPVVQFCRIRAGHLWCQISSSLTKLSLSVSSGSYCTSETVGSRIMVTHLLPYILVFPFGAQWNIQCSDPGCWLCCSVGYYITWLWIRISILSCGAILQDLCRSITCNDNIFLNFSTVFTDGCEWTNVGHPVCLLKNIPIDSTPPPSHADTLGRLW